MIKKRNSFVVFWASVLSRDRHVPVREGRRPPGEAEGAQAGPGGLWSLQAWGHQVHDRYMCHLKTEPVFLNFEGVQELIPRNQFRQPI